MAFDETLADRIRRALARKKGVEEKKRFGGLIFMLPGNMLVDVWKNSLIVRLGQEVAEETIARGYLIEQVAKSRVKPDIAKAVATRKKKSQTSRKPRVSA
jgi:hypothetical protein